MKPNWFPMHRELILEWKNKPDYILAWNFILCFTPYEGEKQGIVDLSAVRLQSNMTDKAWRLFVEHLKEQKMLIDFAVKRLGHGKGSQQTARVNDDFLPDFLEKKQGRSKGQSKGVLKDVLKDSLNPSKNEFYDDLGHSNETPKGQSKGVLKDGHIKEYNSLSDDKELVNKTISKALTEYPVNQSPPPALCLADSEKLFQQIHPWAAVKCLEELQKRNISADWAVAYWGEPSLRALLAKATQIANNSRTGLVWADFIAGTRDAGSVLPVSSASFQEPLTERERTSPRSPRYVPVSEDPAVAETYRLIEETLRMADEALAGRSTN